MDTLRGAVVGLGRIGWKFEDDTKRQHPCTHAGALAVLEGVTLVAGASKTLKSAEEFRSRWKTNRAYTDYRTMVEKEKIDIVGVATNPETHCEIVCALAELGVKGILCEKPIALSLRDADSMIDACEKHGTHLMIMHNRRWNSIFRSAKDMILSDEIGAINSVIGICQGCKPNRNWQSEFEGPLLHDATHLFDILRFLLGDAEWVISDVARASKTDKVEDSAYSLIYFKNGTYATTMVNERTDYMRFEIEVQGSKGKLLLKTNEAELWKYAPSKYASGFRELAQSEFLIPAAPSNVYLDAYRELVDCIRQDRPVLTSTGADGRAALEIIMSIYESKRMRVSRVMLPLPGVPSHLEQAISEGAF